MPFFCKDVFETNSNKKAHLWNTCDSNSSMSHVHLSLKENLRSSWWTDVGRQICPGNFCSLKWCHNEHNVVSNYQPNDCLLNRLFRRRSKKTSNSTLLAFVWGIHRWPVNSPHKRPVTRKMFPFDDVIMSQMHHCCSYRISLPNASWTQISRNLIL